MEIKEVLMLLVEYRLLDKVKVINEGTGPNKKLKVRGKFQKCDEQNNNGRIYPKKILESQVTSLQEKIKDRSLVGALDHPPNDAIHLSQASHLITKLWVEPNGDVMGEAEILSTPSGKIVEALLNDNVKIGISSRGLGTISEGKNGKVVNEDFKLITFDLVSDPSTKGAFPELTESVKLNSKKAQKIVSEMKQQRILLTALESKINERLEEGLVKKANKAKKRGWETGGEANPYIADLRKSRSRLKRKLSPDPDSVSRVDKTVRGYANKNKISKEGYKGFLKSEKKPNLPESTNINKTLITLSEMLIEGIVKKINKAKKKDWEAKKGLSKLAKTTSAGPDNKYHNTYHGANAKADSKIKYGIRNKTAGQAGLRAVARSQESIELILQRIEEGTATSDDIELVKRALSEIVNR